MFQVGEKVVCVKVPVAPAAELMGLGVPSVGCVYMVCETSRIDAFRDRVPIEWHGEQVIRLTEIKNPDVKWLCDRFEGEPWFPADHFRPLTSIEELKALLNTAPKQADSVRVRVNSDGKIERVR